jgi:hypothetical protein
VDPAFTRDVLIAKPGDVASASPGRAITSPTAEPSVAADESQKLGARLGRVLLGEQSSHHRAVQLTAGLGVEQSDRTPMTMVGGTCSRCGTGISARSSADALSAEGRARLPVRVLVRARLIPPKPVLRGGRLSGRDAVCCLARPRHQSVMWDGDEIERVAAIVVDLDQRQLIVGLYDGADGSGRPASGGDQQLDHIENCVPCVRHLG